MSRKVATPGASFTYMDSSVSSSSNSGQRVSVASSWVSVTTKSPRPSAAVIARTSCSLRRKYEGVPGSEGLSFHLITLCHASWPPSSSSPRAVRAADTRRSSVASVFSDVERMSRCAWRSWYMNRT